MASLLKILSTEYATEYKMKRYKKPNIYHGGKDFDLSKRWYVYYSFLNPDTNQFERQNPIYLKINQRHKTKRDRLYHFKALRNALENLLKRGYSPYDIDESEFHTASNALDAALNIKKKDVKETTYKDYYNRVSQFKKYLKNRGFRYSYISDIDKKCVIGFLNTFDGPKNRNNTKAALSSIFSVLADQDYIKTNFIKEIQNKSVRKKSKTLVDDKYFTEAEKLLKENDFMLFMYVDLVSVMFWRTIENVRIEIKDIDFIKGTMSVDTKSKDSKTKIIPSFIELNLKEFVGHRKGRLFELNAKSDIDKRNYMTNRFRKFRSKHNLNPKLTPYMFRHYRITKFYLKLRESLSKEDTIKKLSLITGHTSSAIWEYIHVNDIELPEDYSELFN
ncbi:tyrosine-type recombinase/integrase [Changchengzhania lutea]|uniref:tyrosine-type recombinase/integrase n=1 Tax=Changchengzhania lutea TaxID=2049305 RepID=UPI00163DA5BA|nr:site-specific integrase [Changchengzhania lutea]